MTQRNEIKGFISGRVHILTTSIWVAPIAFLTGLSQMGANFQIPTFNCPINLIMFKYSSFSRSGLMK